MKNNKLTKSIMLSILYMFTLVVCLSVSLFAWYTTNTTAFINEAEVSTRVNDKADVNLYQFNKETKEFDEIDRVSLTMIPTEQQYYKIKLSNFNEIYTSATLNIGKVSSQYPSAISIDNKYVDDLGNPLYPIEKVINIYNATFDEESVAFSLTRFDKLSSYKKSDSIIEIYFAIEFDGSEDTFVTIGDTLDYSNPYQNQIFEINKLLIDLQE